jgi:1,4-dihydroxy-2-naphthoyl-CoA hydrolase
MSGTTGAPQGGAHAVIWRRAATLETVNARIAGVAPGFLDIRVTEIGPDRLRATMPVDARHAQPMGGLHGGVSVLLAETLGSIAATLCLPEGAESFGLDVNANHLARVAIGDAVTAECRPLHLGRSTQVWHIEIRRGDGRLACVARLTTITAG